MQVDLIIGLGSLALTALGLILGGRKWVEGKVETERTERGVQVGGALAEAKDAKEKLNAFQIEAAKTYATKQGVSEAIDRMTDAFKDVGNRVDQKLDTMNNRLDRVIETGRAKAD